MIDQAAPARTTESSDTPWRRPFLTTHTAVGASTREFARLAEGVVSAASALDFIDAAHAPKVRRSPYRTIVQAGPVAVTLTWIRDRADSAAAGQLLVVVWRGSITTGGANQFERPDTRAVTAAVVWEEEYTPEAESEAAWCWRSKVAEAATLTSAGVAQRCADALAREYALATQQA